MIQPVVFTWATKILARDGDDAARAVTLYSMNGKEAPLCHYSVGVLGKMSNRQQAPPLSCLPSGVSSCTPPPTPLR